jgi:hypothetical protein
MGVMGSADTTTTVARITNHGKNLHARAIVDGTSFKIVKFAFGAGGYDPVDPLRPLVIDLNATELMQETYRKNVDVYETASVDGRIRSFAAKLTRTELIGGIGEYALIAEILSSPYPTEVGTFFVYAIGHQGLQSKSRNHVETYRIIVAL